MRQLLPVGRTTEVGEPDLLALYGQPSAYVRAGFVATLDGAVAVDGGSRALSGPADRLVFRTLRAVCDVILVGAGTTRVEDYGTVRLTEHGHSWRASQGLPALPRVAVVSRSLEIDPRVFAGPRPLVVTCAAADASALRGRADVIVAGSDEVDLAQAVDRLAEKGLRRILCEGGPTLLAAIVAAGRLDELCLTTIPLLAGATGTLLPFGLDTPIPLVLRHLLEEEGVLLGRYGPVRL